MLKIRLQGTKNDIKWFEKILGRNPKIRVTEFSDCYSNKGTNKYYRVYAEVEKANVRPYNQRTDKNRSCGYRAYNKRSHQKTTVEE